MNLMRFKRLFLCFFNNIFMVKLQYLTKILGNVLFFIFSLGFMHSFVCNIILIKGFQALITAKN